MPIVKTLFIAFCLAWLPVSGSAQVGRLFVSAEAYVGSARAIHVGTIVGLEKIEYGKPLTATQKLGKPNRLSFRVSETIRGRDVETLDIVLSLQSTYHLEFLRKHSIGIMLVRAPVSLTRFHGAEIGIEEQGERVDGYWYHFRVLDPVEIPADADGAEAAAQINNSYDSGRMFTHELGIVTGREAILDRVRAFAKRHDKMLPTIYLLVPNGFGALCGSPGAYCGITLPVCAETRKTLVALKADPGSVLRRYKSRDKKRERAWLQDEIEKALAALKKAETPAPDGRGNP